MSSVLEPLAAWLAGRLRPLGPGRSPSSAAVAPEMLRVFPDRLELADGRLARTFAVRGYPREVPPGWMRILEAHEGELRFSQHVEPVDTPAALAELGHDLRALRASLLLAETRGAEQDPADLAAAEDAARLRASLARGEVQLFTHHLILTVFAGDLGELERRCAALAALLESRMLVVRRCLLEQEAGFQATMPLGRLPLRAGRNFDSDALSASLPPLGDAPLTPTAEVWGLDVQRRTLVGLDRFALPNAHLLVLAGSGSGKSFLIKSILTQSVLAGRRAAVLDPQGEYGPWCAAVGGVAVRLGAAGGPRLNPLRRPADQDPQRWRAACLERLDAMLQLLARCTPAPEVLLAALDAAERSAPSEDVTLQRFAESLRAGGTDGARLAKPLEAALRADLRPFSGGGDGLPDRRAVVFDLQDLVGRSSAVAAAALLLLTHHVLDHLVLPGRPEITVAVDEGHLLLGHAATARFLDAIFRTGRKRGVGVCLATQSVGDLLGPGADPDAARAARGALANAASVFLMRQQNGRELAWLQDLYRVSGREAEWLSTCGPGEGLMIAGGRRTLLRVDAPPSLHPVFATNTGGPRPP